MTITFREATPQDSHALFLISEHSAGDFARRQGYPFDEASNDPALWARRQPLFDYLAAQGERCWLAEDETGTAIGYARSVVHGTVRELTEFFVLPGRQSAGVGRELLARAFPSAGAERRFIVATSDARALARYLKAGVYARFPIFDFRRAPEAASVESDLRFETMTALDHVRDALASIDEAVLGYRKERDHAWLAAQRSGFVAKRGEDVVGYGYVGDDTGPLAVRAADDMPALLAHAETLANARGVRNLGFEVPLINRAAVDHLLRRGFRLQPFFAFMMSDAPFGQFENYVLFSPPFMV
jgi:hypothetical protein